MNTSLQLKIKLLLSFLIVIHLGFSQVVINEVHPRPSGGDTDQAFQSMFNSTVTYGSEYIELYNTSPCNSVDVSCWSIGGMDGGTNGGAFSFPSGTIIAPLSFITIGGPNAPGMTFNLNLAANSARLWHSAATRWHLPNGDGWLSLYDATGASVDAVYWTFASNDPTKLSTDATYTSGALQRISACGGGGLATASTIAGIEYISQATVTGQSFERATDGSMTWSLGTPTPNNCNGACVVGNAFALNSSVIQPSCGQSNGSISFNPSPAGTYTYVWTPNVSSTSSAGSLAAGSYSIQITNSAGCQADTTITLVSTGGITGVTVNPLNPTCGQSNGSVSIGSVTGGVAPYQYNFNTLGLSSATNYPNLSAGSYTLTVQDNAGCTFVAPSISLSNSAGPTDIVVNTTNPVCGQSNGSVTLGLVTGGSAPYQYNFNGTGLSGSTSFSNLAAGTYSLLVQDNSGCVYNAPNIVISNGSGPTAISVTSTNENCDQSNGSVTLGAVSGGVSPYLYNFNGQGFVPTTSFTNLQAGSYTLVVQDNGGCTYIAPSIAIINTPGPSAINVNLVNATCGQANGTVTFGAVTGGTAPYQYNFNNLGFAGTTSFSSMLDGTYPLSVQDANGCVFSAPSIVLSNSSSPNSISVNVNDASCGGTDGSVVLGGVVGGTAPYQYNFNGLGYSSNTTFNNLTAGNFNLTVQDALGCTFSAPPIEILTTEGPTDIVLNSVDATCGLNDGSVTVNSTIGGSSPYQYSWNGSGYTNNFSFVGLAPGNYPIIVKDAGGCTYQEIVTIGGGAPPIADFAINPLAVSIWDANVSLINLSSNDVVVYNWIIPDGNPNSGSTEDFETSFEGMASGTYPITLIVTNSSGCIDTVTKYVELYDEILVFAPNAFTPDGDEYNNLWKVVVANADLTSFNLKIFNRWGEILFESFDSESGWDGTFNGVLVQDGMYTWKLSLKDIRSDQKIEYVGHVTMVK